MRIEDQLVPVVTEIDYKLIRDMGACVVGREKYSAREGLAIDPNATLVWHCSYRGQNESGAAGLMIYCCDECPEEVFVNFEGATIEAVLSTTAVTLADLFRVPCDENTPPAIVQTLLAGWTADVQLVRGDRDQVKIQVALNDGRTFVSEVLDMNLLPHLIVEPAKA